MTNYLFIERATFRGQTGPFPTIFFTIIILHPIPCFRRRLLANPRSRAVRSNYIGFKTYHSKG